ncbi:hypothetical protein VKT23_015349 [Stygiomarasmius scandens]|uniref:Uncharacterized protein n=1 Tax=Marasmiellus scandens TaxID=2682957 RepID=A0ABR1J1C4_9AGAR
MAAISPVKLRPTGDIAKLLEGEPMTKAEKELREAMLVLHGKAEAYKEQALQVQATGVLQQIYCGQLCKKLFAKEEKGKRKKGWLPSKGLPVIMTSDEHYAKVMEHEEVQKEHQEKAFEPLVIKLLQKDLQCKPIVCEKHL